MPVRTGDVERAAGQGLIEEPGPAAVGASGLVPDPGGQRLLPYGGERREPLDLRVAAAQCEAQVPEERAVRAVLGGAVLFLAALGLARAAGAGDESALDEGRGAGHAEGFVESHLSDRCPRIATRGYGHAETVISLKKRLQIVPHPNSITAAPKPITVDLAEDCSRES